MSQIRNWSELPDEILGIIAENSNSIEDFLRFGEACRSWRCVTLDKRRLYSLLKPLFPWLMLATNDDDRRCFVSLSENKFRRIRLPEAESRQCWGSCFGWLVTLGFDEQFHLLNPLTRARLPLPSVSTFIEPIIGEPSWALTPHRSPSSTFKDLSYATPKSGDYNRRCVRKSIVCKSGVDFLVFVTIGQDRNLAVAKPGDNSWTVIKSSRFQEDIVNFNGRFYCVNNRGLFYNICLGSNPTLYYLTSAPKHTTGWTTRYYLLELGGELHMAIRYLSYTALHARPSEFHSGFDTMFFEFFELDFPTRQWERVKTLGDNAVFLGSNTSYSSKASDYLGCKPGCVYFTDDLDGNIGQFVGHDMGVYHLATNKLEPFYDGDGINSLFSPPVWISPNPF